MMIHANIYHIRDWSHLPTEVTPTNDTYNMLQLRNFYICLFQELNQAGFWRAEATRFFSKECKKGVSLVINPATNSYQICQLQLLMARTLRRLLRAGCTSGSTVYFHLFSLLPSFIDRGAQRFFKCLHSYWLKLPAELFQKLEQLREHIKFIQMSCLLFYYKHSAKWEKMTL